MIYHHVKKDEKGRIIYTAKAALLDLKDPSHVIAKIPYPILFPEAEYETKGDVDNVVFPTGVIVRNDELFVYYGTADKYCGLATIKLKEILDELLKYPNGDNGENDEVQLFSSDKKCSPPKSSDARK